MKNVIAGLEEGLQAIAEALEGGNIVPTPAAADEGKVLTAGDDGTASWEDAGSGIPTPTLNDEGKVLRVIPKTQTTVAPEWANVNEVPIGGQNGQVLTKKSNGYGWATPVTPEKELPSIGEGDSGKVLKSYYDSEEGYGYSRWDTVASVPGSSASDSGKVLTCTGKNKYGWAAASGGGGNIDTVRFSIQLSSFSAQTVNNKSMYVAEHITTTLYQKSLNSKLISISASPYSPMDECYNLPMDYAFVRPGIGDSDIGIPAEAYNFASGLEGVDTINIYITYYAG